MYRTVTLARLMNVMTLLPVLLCLPKKPTMAMALGTGWKDTALRASIGSLPQPVTRDLLEKHNVISFFDLGGFSQSPVVFITRAKLISYSLSEPLQSKVGCGYTMQLR